MSNLVDPGPFRLLKAADLQYLDRQIAVLARGESLSDAGAYNVQVLAWLTALALKGVIKFVQKDDTTIQQMLALRQDIFPNCSEESFDQKLKIRAQLISSETISSEGRKLFWYDRD